MSEASFSSFQMVMAIIQTLVYAAMLTVTFWPFISDENGRKKRYGIKVASVGLIYIFLSVIAMFIPAFGLPGMVLAIIIPGILSGWLGINILQYIWEPYSSA